MARYLVGQGANVSTRSIGGFLPVHVAAQYGHFDLLKFLGGNSKVSGLSFGLKNGSRFHFDSETCLNDLFLNVFLM